VFNSGIEKGAPLFSLPPPDLLSKIIFEPSAVQERGWLLLVNAFLSTAIFLMKPSNPRLSRELQWNVWMLLEDSSIFLEPSEIKIQALLLLATHGQEVTTPNLCWTLMSHACQMAQTLAIHLPPFRAPLGPHVNDQRNFLFWSLFMVDKGLSLSFGRSPMLPAYLYRRVPPPDAEYLAKFKPHENPHSLAETRGNEVQIPFGTLFLLKTMALAKLQGDISDMLYNEEKFNIGKVDTLQNELELWLRDIKTVSWAE